MTYGSLKYEITFSDLRAGNSLLNFHVGECDHISGPFRKERWHKPGIINDPHSRTPETKCYFHFKIDPRVRHNVTAGPLVIYYIHTRRPSVCLYLRRPKSGSQTRPLLASRTVSWPSGSLMSSDLFILFDRYWKVHMYVWTDNMILCENTARDNGSAKWINSKCVFLR